MGRPEISTGVNMALLYITTYFGRFGKSMEAALLLPL